MDLVGLLIGEPREVDAAWFHHRRPAPKTNTNKHKHNVLTVEAQLKCFRSVLIRNRPERAHSC